MISRVSSNHTHDIHWPSTPEKEVKKKGNTERKIAKWQQNRQQIQNIDLNEMLFYGVMFWE